MDFAFSLSFFGFIVKFPGTVRKLSDFRIDSSTLMYNRQTTRKGVMTDPEDGAISVINLATSTHSKVVLYVHNVSFGFYIPEV